jgi:lipopolysaccharide transport system ATP-binding protein
VELYGRVGSLLEVGTGFHPELTGRENIFLSGSILGMKKREIEGKLDDIVNFSEIEKFLDTPVKRYSSGMYVRLAFAVAAHMDTEILLVDEVLAVGDAAFQKKCLGKMGDVAAKEGRTVLFVSHNMNAIKKLCFKSILLNSGSIEIAGNTDAVINHYLNGDGSDSKQFWTINDQYKKNKNDILTPLKLSLIGQSGKIISQENFRDTNIYIEFEFVLHKAYHNLTIGISLFNQDGVLVFRSLQTDTDEDQWPELKHGQNKIQMKLPTEILNQGDYTIVLDGGLWNQCWLYNPYECDISINFTLAGGLSKSPYWISERWGIIAPVIPWVKKE